ncbi:amino acid adenylation domain-containing protein [Chryseobacterium nematophagum]|uniref:Amino acid adenylation domain-containing protein n=1 Tax=Chryseobacterium nematophagum TaxID=2305228 RepID=A0A3M7L7P9_9FLAO|nr:non-ribosomal peptide synthetase [Chryseobacterium nematophagum]RMZ58791.1 amino acid adenylation domain-containing protein [Chryseobacterium nematophagum]
MLPKNLMYGFREQVDNYPNAIAIIDAEKKLTYLELDILSSQLADELIRKGVGKEEIVAIHLPRSTQFVISILAVIKVGAAYLPLHLNESEHRLQYMVAESKCNIIISEKEYPHWEKTVEVVDVKKIVYSGLPSEEKYLFLEEIDESQLAYVMYTSGSTGIPKGVCITHSAISNFASDSLWNLENQARVLFHSQVAFDASTFEIWVPLLKGGTIVIAKEDSLNVDYLVKLIAQERVTSVFFTTMLFNLLAKEKGAHLDGVKQILFGGEQCSPDSIAKMKQKLPNTEIVHVYGPTETTTFFSSYSIPSDEILNTVPIGKPMDGMSAYILDNDFEQVVGKEIGELYISSGGIARGYLNQPFLTAEKFFPDPFGVPGSRMYQTGDLVYLNENGDLVFVGRKDQQVKVRGFRVELGEIEEALRAHPNVSESSVVAQKSENGNQLLAYIVPNYSVDSSSDQLKQKQIDEWEKIYDDIYQEAHTTEESEELVGWNSSFDGKPIEPSHMREWLDMTLKRIKSLKPKKVLEIGVGTGMLIKNLCKDTELYWGTDLSEQSITKLNSVFEEDPSLSDRIKLFHQSADSIDELPKQTFDTIIINSVCQYFPDINYFIEVINKAMDLLSPSGKIFIGDIRDFKLQRHFYTEVHLHNTKIETELDLMMAVERDMMMEPELLISPDLFAVWSENRSDVATFETKIKEGNCINEMSQYRYDAILFKKSGNDEKLCEYKNILDWNNCDIQYLNSLLKEDNVPSLCIKGIPNERIAPIIRAYDKVSNNEELGVVKNAYNQLINNEVKLEEFQVLAEENNYELSIIHSQSGNYGVVDIIFMHKSFENRSYGHLYQDHNLSYDIESCANYPPMSRNINQLLIQVKTHLQKKLPEYMLPSTIIPINRMPLTSRGKINKEALLALNSYKSSGGRKASTHIESIVCQLFGETLGLSEVLLDDNFFEMGGNSLTVITLMNRFRDVLNLEVSIKIFFENPTPATLIKKLDFESKITLPLYKQDRPTHIPLSFSQQRLWFLFNLEGANETYSIPLAINLSGKLDKEKLTNTLDDVLERHESLRTIFYEKEGIPYQKIVHQVKTNIDFIEASEKDLQETLNHESRYAFNLTEEIPVKAKLLYIDENTHVLLIIIHHIAFDGWSFAPFWKDLSTAYSARINNEIPKWNPLPIQYSDYALWQRNTFHGEQGQSSVIDRQLNYWTKNLNNLPDLVSLPSDYFRPEKPAYKGDRKSLIIPSKLHDDLILLSQSQNVTLFMILHAGLCCLLTRFGAGNDIVIGTPIAGRKDSSVRDLIGFFVNNLVLRIDTSGNPTFQALLKKVKEQDLSAYAHEDIPFDRLVQELKQSGTTSWHPLFQILFAFQNQPQAQVHFSGLDSKFEFMKNQSCRFDLVINLFAEKQSENKDIEGFVEYNTDLFKAETIEHFIESYIHLLKSIVENPEQKINKINIGYNNSIDYSSEKRMNGYQAEHFVSLFQKQVDATPKGIAISHKDCILTYEDVKSSVNRLARLLITKGIGAEQVVALSIPRSIDWIIATLAILETGAAYMPIDSQFPEERIHYMLDKSKASLLLTTTELASTLFFIETETLVIDDPETCETINNLSGSPIEPSELLSPLFVSSPAYIIYTSGSSGVPKPVVVTHEGIMQVIDTQKNQFKLNESSRVLLFASQSFDGFFWELCSLLRGAHLVIADTEDLVAGRVLVNTISEHKITHVTLPPAVLTLMENEKMEDLEMIIVSGEAPSGGLLSKWAHNRNIINGYGPTESTVCTTLSLPLLQNTIPNIGQPLVNSSVYVLDEFLDPVPVGECGELYISSPGLARGYLYESAMTAERFLPDPFGNEGSRMYRTGDLARWTAEHKLVFMGRMDNQIKIRGFRVEPTEIETALEEHPLIEKAAVKLSEDASGNKQLKAYVTVLDTEKENHLISSEKLRNFLKKILPSYMIPAMISIVEIIPLTINGKIDYSALIDSIEFQNNNNYPVTPTEIKLYSIFCELLSLKEISIDDSFFDIGGHSLLGAQLISKIYKEWSLELPIGMLFQYPSIVKLSKIIDQSYGTENKIIQTPIAVLNADATLADSVVVDLDSQKLVVNQGEPQFILLTGITGFLGAFLLDALFTKYNQATIYCLVRAANQDEAKQRIIQNVSNYKLEHAINSDRIKPLCGDLSLDNFGLSPEEYNELVTKVDCIYHNGAKISGVSSYQELKKTNVKGTYEVIRLATQCSIKPIHYVSTLAVTFNNNEPAHIVSENERLQANNILPNGYTQNKWVEEEMLWAAHGKGVPISIYRPGRISGSTKNGVGNQNDAFWQLVLAMLKINAVPVFKEENLCIDLIPVDCVAHLIVHFSSDEAFNGRTANLFNQLEFSLLIDTLQGMGYHLEKIDFQSWKDKLKHFADQNDDQKELQKAVLLSDSMEGMFKLSSIKYCTDMIQNERKQNKIESPMVGSELLVDYVKYFIQIGFFPAPLLKSE